MTLVVDTVPCEGRKPKIPQYAAGTLTLPPVSVPIEIIHKQNKRDIRTKIEVYLKWDYARR